MWWFYSFGAKNMSQFLFLDYLIKRLMVPRRKITNEDTPP